MGSLAILFAGQGNQYPHIGLDWVKYDPRLIKYVNEISLIGGFNLMEIIEATDDRINDTFYAQPAIVLQSILAYKVLACETKIVPKAIAGFSLGEYSALHVAKVFDFQQTMSLVFERAKAMQSCSSKIPGSMAAILGLDTKVIESICEEISKNIGTVVCANYNCPGQLVISGEKEAVLSACDACKTAGAKRTVILNVSGAFHSPLMSLAAERLKAVLSGYKAQSPLYPLYSNVTGLPYQTSEIIDYLPAHLVSPVRFEAIIKNMMNQGITHFIEIGPKATLSAFVKKINPEAITINLDSVSDLENVKGWLEFHGFIE